MSKFLACLLCLCMTHWAIAQNTATLKGRLIDSTGKQSLKDASVTILDARDSTLEVFGLTKEDGSFEIKNISFGNYLVHISFQGYETIFKPVTLSKTNTELNLGSIYLKQQANDLGMVTVTQSPITVKNDTLEYNAGSFKTKPNAVVEDLLKKLPGVEVDKNGAIKAQGENVTRVLVDGKRFFGDDPKLATKNLPPDVVDKIQVFDDLSDQSKFTGFDDGNRVKTINITTKKDKRKGYFGKGVAGIGSDERYDESFNIHRMNGTQQISLTGQANNTNRQNFTTQDFLGGGNGGGRGRGGGGGGGITTSLAGGINYRDSWSKDADVSGSYFYNKQNAISATQSLTQNILTQDSSTFNNRNRNSERINQNHRFNFNIEAKLDTMNSFVFRPGVSFQHATPNARSSTLTTTGDNGKMVNQSVNSTYNTNSGYNINGSNLQLRHRFNKRFRTLSLDLGFSANSNNSNGYNYAVNTFYLPSSRTDTINQHYISTSNAFSFNPSLSYTEPIASNQILELNYSYAYNNNHSENNTYRLNNNTHEYSQFDSLFSNSYKYTSKSNRATLSYRLQNQQYNFSIGTGLQFTEQHSINTTKKIDVFNRFTNFTPTANFQFLFSKSKNLRINYTGRTGQPSIMQLQPLTTTSDSINFQVGNPNLKPQFTHSLRLLYHSFDPVTQKLFLVTLNASTIVNDIQSSIIQNPNGGKTTTSVNLDGTYNVSAYVNFGFPLRKPKSNLNFTTNAGYSQMQTLVNHASNYTRNTSLSQSIRWTTNLKDNFDMNFSATSTLNMARNTLQASQNINYYSQALSAEITYYTSNGWIFATDFDYTYTGNQAAGYNASVPLLNPSIAKQFLKNNAGELRLSVFDLLNQNVSVTRTVTGNTIQDQRSNVLTRYALLTFTYNLRRFGARPRNNRQPQMIQQGKDFFNNGEKQGGQRQIRTGGGGGGRPRN